MVVGGVIIAAITIVGLTATPRAGGERGAISDRVALIVVFTDGGSIAALVIYLIWGSDYLSRSSKQIIPQEKQEIVQPKQEETSQQRRRGVY